MTSGPERQGIDIQVAGMAAAAAIADLHARCFEDAWSRDSIARLLEAPTTLALTVHAPPTGISLGFLLAQCVADEAEILTFAIDPARRNSGHGLALLRGALDHLRSRGTKRLLLEVAADNTAALALYGRVSFRESHRRRGYYARAGKPAVDAIVMDLRL